MVTMGIGSAESTESGARGAGGASLGLERDAKRRPRDDFRLNIQPAQCFMTIMASGACVLTPFGEVR